MTLSTPGCPASEIIQSGVRLRLVAMEGIDDADIELVWEPRWSPQAMGPVARERFGIEDNE
jgi:metal-sulfur cluster biosynthetic enzyme